MKGRCFIPLVVVISAAGLALLAWQRRAIEEARDSLALIARNKQASAWKAPARLETGPSPELLKLRNEVTLLARKADEPASGAAPRVLQKQAEDDWNEIHSVPKLSEQPGFVSIARLTPGRHATPAEAFESLQFAMRNQNSEPITPTRMKEVWDVPDDFDDPEARYSIHLGQGIGGETGYRVVREQTVRSNEVTLTIEFEMKDGSSMRQERTLVSRNGRWRVKPENITRSESPANGQ